MSIDVATCSWREVTPEMGVPVAISVGKPRRPLFSFETVNDLAPYGLLGRKDLTDAEWRDAYLHRVERRATRIVDALDELGAKYQAAVSCCFVGNGSTSPVPGATAAWRRTG